MSSVNIGGNGGNSFAFDKVGDRVEGTIVSVVEQQQTDFDQKPAYWDNGQPKMMYKVELQTTLRNPEDPTDDGVRSVYLKGSKKPESHSSLAAALVAVREATGGNNLSDGDLFSMEFIGEGQRTKAGFNPPKHYKATYRPLPKTASTSLGDSPAQGQAAPAAAPAVATQMPSNITPEVLAVIQQLNARQAVA